jgi:CheY-like chemotaxis protein
MPMGYVLIVDDDDGVSRMFELFLRSHGYNTVTARNGQEALDRMRARRPCLVLLDVQMPVMDGWQFRSQQLREPALAKVPVLCLTALFHAEDVAQRMGVCCLRKPADFPSVLQHVVAACGVCADSREPAGVGVDRADAG